MGLAFPVSVLASDAAVPPELLVKIFPDHYVAGGERFTSLEALEAWVKPSGARIVRLDACGQTSRRLLAVVQRLNRANVRQVEIRASAGDPGCPDAEAERVTAPLAAGPLAADSAYLATDRYGRSTMP